MMAQEFRSGDLIPGLPDELSELCLLRLPFPCPPLLPSVSSAWNRTLSNPSFFTTKSRLSLTKPYLLALPVDQFERIMPWQCLDLISKNWYPLPPMPMPFPDVGAFIQGSMVSSVAIEKGEMYVFTGDSKCYVMVYSVATNSWRIGNHSIKVGGSFFTSAAIGGKAFALSIDGWEIGPDRSVRVHCYDPVLGSLVDMAETMCGTARHDAVVIGKKIYVIESWDWPRNHAQPKGRVYDCELNTWKDMPLGMRNGWIGLATTVGPNLFVFELDDDNRIKVYDHVTDSWMQVKGSGIPKAVRKPYIFSSCTVAADEETGKIYVVGGKLNVAIATLIEVESKKWEIEWDVIEGPDAFSNFFLWDSQILYA